MLIKPHISARTLWALVALGLTAYLFIAFAIQSPEGYWDLLTPASAKKPECIVDKLLGDPWGEVKQQSHSTARLKGWYNSYGHDQFEGQWSASPATEDYVALMRDSDKRLLDELNLYSGAPTSKSSRIGLFYNLDTVEDWKSYFSGLNGEGLAPLTKFAQSYLQNHQHPADCNGKAFLVFRKFPNDESFGLGAVIQSIAQNLALAIRTNRILVYDPVDPPGKHFIEAWDPNHGSPGGCGQSLDCIFHKLSSCTHDDVTRAIDKIYFPWTSQAPEMFYRIHPNSLPPILGQALREQFPDMPHDAAKYWWRGQAAAYTMRPNGATMKRLRELRMDPEMHGGFHLAKGNHPLAGTPLRMPFPVPEGAFSMHVRHGDKGIEMNLVEFKEYVLQAEEYVVRNPQSSRRIAFLSTEDPGVIEDAKNISSLLPISTTKGWEWYWSNIPRFNGGPETQLQLFGNRTEMTIKWLLQLTMALECENFVGTRGSGWNRLIDQLRCTWHSSCKSSYLEVGDDASWAYYGF